MSRYGFMVSSLLLGGLAIGGSVSALDWEAEMKAGYARVEQVYLSGRTHLIYNCPPSLVTPARKFNAQGMFFPEDGMGYGRGLEDTAIVGGVALSMLVDWHSVTGDEGLRAKAHEIYLGLCNLATAHGIPGFIARGLCVEDGKGICALTSRDQITHWVHGLWRYYHSPLSDEASRKRIGELMVALSERVLRNCVKENDYDYLRADGSRDVRGICRMWDVNPHEIARLPMIYLATWDVTGDGRWLSLYERYIDEALEKSLSLRDPAIRKAKRGMMPEYTLLQMQSSLELLLAVDRDSKRKSLIRAAMDAPAEIGVERAVALNGGDSRWLCGAGETLLAQLMVPGREFSEAMESLMYKSLSEPRLGKAGSTRIIHMLAVYWRYRANQKK